jgi:O-acetyl-ADP-ribose deacetylase (regulator of RNase III)
VPDETTGDARAIDRRLTVLEGDITGCAVDAVVNAANGALKRGGGVDGAIHRAAGPELQVALDGFGGCPTGECRITPGFGLKARHIIHCVGPVWRGGGYGEEALLAVCYRNALALAARHGCRSLAFPAISTGIYGFPRDRAAGIAVTTVRDELARAEGAGALYEICFVCFDRETADLYRGRLDHAR